MIAVPKTCRDFSRRGFEKDLPHWFQRDLEFYFKMDEPSGQRFDASKNGHRLLQNAAVPSDAGKVGAAARQNGNGTYLNYLYMDMMTTPAARMDIFNEYTVCYWAKFIANAGYSAKMAVYAATTGGGGQTWALYPEGSYGTGFSFILWKVGGGSVRATSPTAIVYNNSTWYFVAATYSKSSAIMKISVNGEAWTQTSTAGVSVIPPIAGDRLNLLSTGFGYPMYGLLDEVTKWKRVLSNDEIETVRQFGLAGCSVA